MTGKANEDLLADMHGLLTEAMIGKLRSGEATAADMGVMRQMLKDNNITADPETNKNLKSIAAELPDDLDDGTIVPMYGP